MPLKEIHVVRGLALFFGAIGAFCIVSGIHLKYYGLLGPGPGFFPIWIGVFLLAASLPLLIRTLISAGPSEPFFESASAGWRVLGLTLSFVTVWFLLDTVGFRIAILIFALFVPRIIDRQALLTTALIALACSFGVAYFFETWLTVQLPAPSFRILDDLGL